MVKIKIRELSRNEKNLLFILGGLIIILGIYRLMITPQTNKLSLLNEEEQEYKFRLDEINNTLEKEAKIHVEWSKLNKEKEEIISQYFPEIDQAQIIYLLNSLIEHENISIEDLNFNRPSYEDLGGFQVENMEISLPYKGEYSGIINVINAIRGSERKILIDSLSMNRFNEGLLSGNIDLKIYSLKGIADSYNKNVIDIDTSLDVNKATPFSQYDGYYAKGELDEDLIDGEIEDGIIKEDGTIDYDRIPTTAAYTEEVLLDFENPNNYFLPSQALVKGNVLRSTNSKSKKYSLRFEYDILAIGEVNRAYIDISRNKINFKYPPSTIGLWVYSYDYSPVTVGAGFSGQMGEEEYISFTEGIGWIGWKYLELSPPEDINLYPLELDKLYVEMPKGRDDFGVILMDKLGAVYSSNTGDNNTGNYTFHIVSKGETIEEISKIHYGTVKFKNEIMKLNDIEPGNILPVGKVLVLKKR